MMLDRWCKKATSDSRHGNKMSDGEKISNIATQSTELRRHGIIPYRLASNSNNFDADKPMSACLEINEKIYKN